MDLRASPWILTPMDVGGEIRPSTIGTRLISVSFMNYDDPDHRCVIEDSNGRKVFDMRGSADLVSQQMNYPLTAGFFGLRLVQLDSGICHIHIP